MEKINYYIDRNQFIQAYFNLLNVEYNFNELNAWKNLSKIEMLDFVGKIKLNHSWTLHKVTIEKYNNEVWTFVVGIREAFGGREIVRFENNDGDMYSLFVEYGSNFIKVDRHNGIERANHIDLLNDYVSIINYIRAL